MPTAMVNAVRGQVETHSLHLAFELGGYLTGSGLTFVPAQFIFKGFISLSDWRLFACQCAVSKNSCSCFCICEQKKERVGDGLAITRLQMFAKNSCSNNYKDSSKK